MVTRLIVTDLNLQVRRQREEQDNRECQAVRKMSDYYQLLEFVIGDLKLLICAEVDCVDDEGQPMELKFGKSDKAVSTWSQCFLSRVSNVVQAIKTWQTDCSIVHTLENRNISSYFDSKDHRNAQLMVFYNVLKQIKSTLVKDLKTKKEKVKGYETSGIYRVGRYGSQTEATMFTVEDSTPNLITKEQYDFVVDCKPNSAQKE